MEPLKEFLSRTEVLIEFKKEKELYTVACKEYYKKRILYKNSSTDEGLLQWIRASKAYKDACKRFFKAQEIFSAALPSLQESLTAGAPPSTKGELTAGALLGTKEFLLPSSREGREIMEAALSYQKAKKESLKKEKEEKNES